MKTPFKLSQKILTIVSTVIIAGCIAGDIFALFLDFMIKSDWVFIVNMALSAVSIGVFIVLIRKPEITGVVSMPCSESGLSVLSATRTYICIVYLDVALILALVVFGSSVIPNAELSIIGVAATVFIIGAVKYIFDSRRINQNTQAADKAISEKNEDHNVSSSDDPAS